MTSWTAVLVLWLAAGVVTSVALTRQGHPAAVVAAALLAWPLVLPLVAATTSEPLDRLAAALREAGEEADLGPLRAALADATTRLSRVDRVVAEEAGVAPPEALAELVRARDHARSELHEVHAEVARLRIRIGLRALEGAPLRERLADLTSRLRALDEVAGTMGR